MTSRQVNVQPFIQTALWVCTFGACLGGCNSTVKEQKSPQNNAQLTDWQLSFQASPQTNWELSGNEVQSTYENVYLKGLVVSEAGSGLSLTGSHGTWSFPQHKLTLHHVKLRQGKETLLMPRSELDFKHNLWRGGSFVLKSASWQINGQSFQADLPLNSWAGKQIHATFEVQDH